MHSGSISTLRGKGRAVLKYTSFNTLKASQLYATQSIPLWNKGILFLEREGSSRTVRVSLYFIAQLSASTEFMLFKACYSTALFISYSMVYLALAQYVEWINEIQGSLEYLTHTTYTLSSHSILHQWKFFSLLSVLHWNQ